MSLLSLEGRQTSVGETGTQLERESIAWKHSGDGCTRLMKPEESVIPATVENRK